MSARVKLKVAHIWNGRVLNGIQVLLFVIVCRNYFCKVLTLTAGDKHNRRQTLFRKLTRITRHSSDFKYVEYIIGRGRIKVLVKWLRQHRSTGNLSVLTLPTQQLQGSESPKRANCGLPCPLIICASG